MTPELKDKHIDALKYLQSRVKHILPGGHIDGRIARTLLKFKLIRVEDDIWYGTRYHITNAGRKQLEVLR